MLNNIVWDSLIGEHKHLSLGQARACRYRPEISPFAAVVDDAPESWSELASIVEPGEVILVRKNKPADVLTWKIESETSVVQYVLAGDAPAALGTGLRKLGREHVPAMLELTELVLPGYFRERGIEMGAFYGIFDGEKLAAMTGERVFPAPYKEITAVCTHPDYQGRGYAAKLVQHVSHLMREAGLKPFLHTGEANTRARALYERLGFINNGVALTYALRRI